MIWISVTDQLPEVNKKCLIWVWDNFVKTAMYKGKWPKGGNAWLADDLDNYPSEDVTHWMPLPEPPTKD